MEFFGINLIELKDRNEICEDIEHLHVYSTCWPHWFDFIWSWKLSSLDLSSKVMGDHLEIPGNWQISQGMVIQKRIQKAKAMKGSIWLFCHCWADKKVGGSTLLHIKECLARQGAQWTETYGINWGPHKDWDFPKWLKLGAVVLLYHYPALHWEGKNGEKRRNVGKILSWDIQCLCD